MEVMQGLHIPLLHVRLILQISRIHQAMMFHGYGILVMTSLLLLHTLSLLYVQPYILFGDPDTTSIYTGNSGEPVVQQGCAPLNVLFTKLVPGSSSWNWDFGDGTTSSLQFPSHMYSNPGIYNVVLTTSDT